MWNGCNLCSRLNFHKLLLRQHQEGQNDVNIILLNIDYHVDSSIALLHIQK